MNWPLAILLICQAFTFRMPQLQKAGAAAATPTMTITTNLGVLNTTSAANSYSTAATYTPTANALVIAIVASANTPSTTPTFSGNGLTWVQIGTTNFNTLASPTLRLTFFRAMGASPTTTAGTADFGGVNQAGCHIRVFQFVNADTSGANGSGAIVQVGFNGNDASTNPNITLASLIGSANAVYAVANFNVTAATFNGSPESGWTTDYAANFATPFDGIYGVFRLATTDNTVAITGTSTAWAAMAIEIKQAP